MTAARVAIIGAHPDDELLGAGGTLARHVKAGQPSNRSGGSGLDYCSDSRLSIPGGRNPGMDPVVVLRAIRHAVAQTRGGGWLAFLEFSSTSITRLSSGPAYDTGTWRR